MGIVAFLINMTGGRYLRTIPPALVNVCDITNLEISVFHSPEVVGAGRYTGECVRKIADVFVLRTR